jgi:23S rRNA pseudouridine1911/1915/1917 synthase
VFLSRSRVQHLIESGAVEVDGEFPDKSEKLKGGEIIHVEIPDPESDEDIPPEDLAIDVVYEDEDIIVVFKPAGIATHPTSNAKKGSLINALKWRNIKLPSLYYPYRPGIVHRLDKKTSGLLVVAKTERAYLRLVEMIKARSIKRHYRAITLGNLPGVSGKFEWEMGRHPVDRKRMAVREKGGKPAVTLYKVLERYPGLDYAEAQLLTGRTHQIRVHFAHARAPVFGDDVYGDRPVKYPVFEALERMGVTPLEKTRWITAIDGLNNIRMKAPGHMLHAYKLTFKHPFNGSEMQFEYEMPGYFTDVLKILRKLGGLPLEP